ncbi:MAG: type I DNA topoisomerase, partial [Negativicutes bacterium]|nr:type I DNA topoisomerase [Negativicutes bacterium]
MSKALVVVESPAKAKTIEKFLGRGYTVRASMGHLRDLPKSQFGVDVDHEFTPKYINIRGKGDLIKSLKDEAKKATTVYLATDPDREGEAIAWHLAHILGIPAEKACRIEFNEITKPAIQKAVKHPRSIDFPRVDAQQARRILDRIVGYKLSPLLWRKVRKGLSAGRVQSVAVRLICDREKEIQDFVSEEYWTVTAKLRENAKSPLFDAELVSVDGKKPQIGDEETADSIVGELDKSAYAVREVKRRERRRNPAPPFITSTLQQDASRKLGFTTRKTMMLAQQLYEGIDIVGVGPVGLLTYIRTDSTRVATSAQDEARTYVTAKHGATYLPEKAPVYASKKSAQDAHEAIRPTSLELTLDVVRKSLSRDQMRLYTLVWERFIASQMSAAVYDTLTVEIAAGRFGLRASGSQLKFPGFLAVYGDSKEDQEKDLTLPDLKEGTTLKLQKVVPTQHFTEPPPRYTEASLVKILEEKAIGRPSTYAPIIETIVNRGYVERVEKKFEPTDLGFVVVDLLKEYFPDIVDADFTAGMENRLDDIAEGERTRNAVLSDFYQPFATTLASAEEQIGHVELPVEVSDVKCENCGQFMVVKQGRYGNFLACPGFPACRNTKPILKETGVNCPKCQGGIVERRTKRGKVFFGCSGYPQCDFTTWDTPLKENCPECGSFKVKHNFRKNRFTIRCANEACPTRVAEAAAKPETKKPAT